MALEKHVSFPIAFTLARAPYDLLQEKFIRMRGLLQSTLKRMKFNHGRGVWKSSARRFSCLIDRPAADSILKRVEKINK